MITLLLAALLASPTTPCPTIKIKGPCPTKVECTNLKDVVCPPCPACPSSGEIHCPSPCAPNCSPCPPPEHAPPAPVPVPPSRPWGVPVSLGLLPAGSGALGWHQSAGEGKHDEPRIELDSSHHWLAGAGISYALPSRWSFAAQALYVDGADLDASWARRPRDYGYRAVHQSQVETHGSGAGWGLLVTVTVPLGGR